MGAEQEPPGDYQGSVTAQPQADLEEMRALGVILAVNRNLLHPVGLALGINQRSIHTTLERDLLSCPFCEGSKPVGARGFELDQVFVHDEECPIEELLAIARQQLVIFDSRDDPEGVVFTPWTEERVAKVQAFREFAEPKIKERQERLGFVVEPPRCPKCGWALVPTPSDELVCARRECLMGTSE